MAQKRLLTENQIKQVIREEFAKDGIILTEEELNELFGLFGKSKLVKQIMKLDPDGAELNKLGYDAATVPDLDKGALKSILGDLRDVKGVKAPKGILQKVKDVYKGIGDIGMFTAKAGTLLGGDETFDIEKRNALKDDAKKLIEAMLEQLGYEPLKKLYPQLVQQKFPNNDKGDFKGIIAKLQSEYNIIVRDFEKEQIDAERANNVIGVLRALVIYFQDFAMSDKYYYINEAQMGAAQGAVSKNFIAAYGAKFPLGLAALGLGAMAAGFAADSDFFQSLLQKIPRDMDQIPNNSVITKAVQETIPDIIPLGEIQANDGIIKVVQRLTPLKNFGHGGGGTLGELTKYPKVVELLQASMMDQANGPAALAQAIQQNADPVTLFCKRRQVWNWQSRYQTLWPGPGFVR